MVNKNFLYLTFALLLFGTCRPADASQFRCWLRALFPAAGGNNSTYRASDFPDHVSLLNDPTKGPAVKEMLAHLANKAAEIYRMPLQKSATAYNFAVIDGLRRITQISGGIVRERSNRIVEREYNLPLMYESWISKHRRPSYPLPARERAELHARLVDARVVRADGGFSPVDLHSQAWKSLDLVAGIRTIFHTCTDGTAVAGNIFLERDESHGDRGHKLLLTAPDNIDALIADMVRRLDGVYAGTLPEKRAEFIAAYHAFLQAWPFERGEIEIGTALFAGYHLGIFDQKMTVFLNATEWLEVLTLGQGAFDHVMRKRWGWPLTESISR